MTLRPASSLPDEFSPISARLLRRTLVLAALTAAMPVWADAPAQAAASSPAAEAPSSTLTVKPGQSLNDLAVEVTQSHDKGVLARVSQALFAANPRAFMKHDPSLLMVGATLQVPAEATGGAAVAASAASGAVAASSPAPSASAVAVPTASATAAVPAPVAVAASATSAAASAPAASQPASSAVAASEAAEAGTMADNASASTGASGASAAAPASASSATATAGAAVSAASATLAGVKNELDDATKAWAGLGDDVRTGVLTVLAAAVLLFVGLVWRSRRRARAEGKAEPFVATPTPTPAPVRPAAAPVPAPAPVAASPDVPGADAASEVPVRSAAAQALARAMSPDPDQANLAGEPSAAPVAEPVPVPGSDASKPMAPQEVFSYHTKMVGQVMPVAGTHAASAEVAVQEAAQPQPLRTIPLDAIAALDGLEMGLPPRISTGPIEHAAAGPADDSTSAINGAGGAAAGGLGSVPFDPLDLGFDLEHSASAAGASQALSPEVLARIARNKLELAHEYVNIGDLAGARVLTQEVVDAGHPDTREAAQALLARLKELS